MKYSEVYKNRIGCNSPKEVFDYLILTLKEEIKQWDYFINWDKVLKNTKRYKDKLSLLNTLIGKNNIEAELVNFLKAEPSICQILPALIAYREGEKTGKVKILTNHSSSPFEYKEYEFLHTTSISDGDIQKVIEFIKSTGFLELLINKDITSIVDYFIGLEAGLDTNARKNRTGKAMETILENLIEKICLENNLEYIRQATTKKIKNKWGLELSFDKSSLIIDFAIYNKAKLYLLEANFYSGGGSKLKSTAGEYKTLFKTINNQGHNFIWITDGEGWKTSSLPLEETFNHIDHLLNLEMVSKGLLEDIVTMNL
ncbi:MAG: hypothetical protein A3B68_09580 [Candidatus Melainabacteria bacterium RIFCSPHIGHO2_02_FULL_34_12]|nr:MAG: hypothetical protein A3B68_09580 [Candidatus Melainabacteria bacterium RIFCSPHIGHO2_02_FULL_34_12]